MRNPSQVRLEAIQSASARRRGHRAAGLCGVACAAALLLGGSPARALDPEWELGVHVGAHFFNDQSGLGRDQWGGNPSPTSAIMGLSFQSSALWHAPLFGLRLGVGLHPRFMLEAELGVMPTRTAGTRPLSDGGTQPLAQVTAIGWRGNALFHILTGRVRPFVLLGLGGLTSLSSNTYAVQADTDLEIHGGVGVKYDISPRWGVRLDGRVLGVLGPDQNPVFVPEGEVMLAVYGMFGGHRYARPGVVDTDGDGVADSEDRCPAQPGPVDNGGCPDKDSDGDGIIDRLDKCPDRAGPSENGGCPEADRDGDGVVDRLDKCPDVPGVASPDGCPEPSADSDGDGILDKDDKCPTQAGPRENGGCPDTDRDKDGIVDRLDQCPDEPETRNGYKDDDGCPDEVPKAVQRFTGVIKGINFDSGRATLRKDSFVVLAQALKVLKEYTEVRLEISGHTDNIGTAEANTKLSRERAEAVKKYFEDQGIGDGRLTAAGFGPSKPLADNKTAPGRAKNRRVEFQLQSK